MRKNAKAYDGNMRRVPLPESKSALKEALMCGTIAAVVLEEFSMRGETLIWTKDGMRLWDPAD